MALECKVLISKESGVKIEVLNEDKKTTQTFHMDGLKIEMKIENTQSKKTSKMVQEDGSFKWTVEGSEEKTSIEQTDELVEIKCKDFKVSTRERPSRWSRQSRPTSRARTHWTSQARRRWQLSPPMPSMFPVPKR